MMFSTNSVKLPNVLRKNELIKLVEVVDDPKCMVAYLLASLCGLRISEVCNLKIEDVDLENRLLRIVDSKNPNRTKEGYGKDRLVAIPKPLAHILELWKRYLDLDGCVWIVPYNARTLKNTKIKGQYLRVKYNNHLKKAGLYEKTYITQHSRQRQKFTFHSLRHFYGTWLYDNSVDIQTTAKLLGHANTQTTEIYRHVGLEKQKKEIDRVFGDSFEDDVKGVMLKEQPTIIDKSPEEILKQRLAKGEIDIVSYRRLLMELNGEVKVIIKT